MAGDQRGGAVVDRDPLAVGDAPHHGRDLLGRRTAEVKAVTAVDDRRQHLVGLGRRQHEDGPRRRLLKRLEERVPGLGGEHVRLVQDVDLVLAGDGRVGDLLTQFADVVDRVVGCGVHLDHVERGRARDRDARVADATRRDRRPVDAVQAGREDLGHARLAGAARADEQVGVVDLVRARRRATACARRAPDRPRPRTCGGGGGDRARGQRTRESSLVGPRPDEAPATTSWVHGSAMALRAPASST